MQQVFGLIRRLYIKSQDDNPFNANKNLPRLHEDSEHYEYVRNNDMNKVYFLSWIVMPKFQNVAFGDRHSNGGGENNNNVMVL